MDFGVVERGTYTTHDDRRRITRRRHDPCILDTLLAVVRFMAGEWKSRNETNAERKRPLTSVFLADESCR